MKKNGEELAINKFCGRILKAKHAWETSGGSHTEWIQFYETKVDAMDELRTAIPQINAIDMFWPWLYTYHTQNWAQAIHQQVQTIKKGVLCIDCGTLVPWPAKRCDECAESHKKFLVEKREIQKQLNKRRSKK